MPENLFWNGSPRYFEVYRKLNKINISRQNESAWWQGAYNYKAFDVIAYNLTREKGQQAVSYPSKPMRITPKTQEEKNRDAELEKSKAVAFFDGLKKTWEKNHVREHNNTDSTS